MKSIFEKIADRELPSEIIWEDDNFVAFLDVNPKVVGHTLVTSKKNIGEYLFDLEDGQYTALLRASKTVSKILKDKYNTKKVAMYVEGFLINHVHIHLLPVNNASDLRLN